MNHYQSQRNVLMQRLPDGLIILAGAAMITRNNDVEYVFRQNSNFLYLSGVEEPGCFLLLDPRRRKEILFIPHIDTHHRVWLGHVPSPEEAAKLFGIKRVLYTDKLPQCIRAARGGYKTAYADAWSAQKFKSAFGTLRLNSDVFLDALDELRICKTAGELELMKAASIITGRAHRNVMRQTQAGLREYQVQAIFESACLSAGLRHLAYPSIVAAGVNGAVLHYVRNDALLKNGDLLLIDAGAENKGYAADITRTFPINGRFTRRQRDIYSIVLETQKSSIESARAGAVSADLHLNSMRLIAEGLKSLGILKGETQGLVDNGAVRLFYPHGLTHTLGLDVHDAFGGTKRKLPNPYKVPVRFVAKLEPGFVITMEPGIYFIATLINDPKLRRKYKDSVNFAKAEAFLDFGGVRIEDNVVIRPDGPPLNLTDVPKEIADVEAACGAR